jgi:acyl-CoA synthetase (NDP forming)
MSDSLSVFSDPRSVVVVGASADPTKWGYRLARGALAGSGRRAVHLVNSKATEIAGVRSVASLSDVDGTPDLVVLCTPAASAPEVVEQALERGARGFVGITSGIDAIRGAGTERRLAERIRSAGARLIGPNCLGLYDAAHQLELVWGTFTPGSLGIVSQSGQVGLELAWLAAKAGVGVSRFVSIGNQVDVSAVDLLHDLAHNEATKAVVLYLESFAGGRDLVAALGRLRDAGKPVAVLTVGATEASRAAARSHTGALTASTDVVAAACRAAGAVLVDTPAQAVDLAHLLAGRRPPSGRRVAVVSDGGGHGAIAADTLARHGLMVPRLSAGTSARLASLLSPAAAVGNPVDLAGAGEQDMDTYAHLVDIVASSGEVDTVVLSGYFGCYGADAPELVDRELDVVEALARLANTHGRSVVVHSMSNDSLAVRTLRELGVPTFDTVDAVARSLGLAAEIHAHRDDPVPPEVAAAKAGDGSATRYMEGRGRLAAHGVAYPRAAAVRTVLDVRAATADLTAPYVVKAGWLEHKTEVGGVVAGLVDAAAAEAALGDMRARLGDGEYVVEEMDRRAHVVEMIVGALRDPYLGPVVLVGLGGVQAELYRDVRVALAPVAEPQAVSMIESLAAYPLLRGWRGRPAVDIVAAARVVVAVSRLLAESTDVVECEINPLRVGPGGAIAVDAHVVAVVTDGVPAPRLAGAPQ